jgi:hypothetical protein
MASGFNALIAEGQYACVHLLRQRRAKRFAFFWMAVVLLFGQTARPFTRWGFYPAECVCNGVIAPSSRVVKRLTRHVASLKVLLHACCCCMCACAIFSF